MTQGVAAIDFCASGMGTRLAHLYQSDPLRVMFPRVPAGEPLQAALITISGGMVGGDAHRVRVAAGRNASAMVVGQAAEKVYRSNGPDCTIDIDLNVEDGAWLEWLPQETIMFDGARLRRRAHADVAPGGRLLAGEVVVFGRTAMGETVTSGLLHDEWEVFCGGRPMWADAQHWTDHSFAAPSGGNAVVSLATLVYVGGGPDTLSDLRGLVGPGEVDGVRVAATRIEDIVLVRWLGTDHAALRRHFGVVWAGFRHLVAGWADTLPRLWHV